MPLRNKRNVAQRNKYKYPCPVCSVTCDNAATYIICDECNNCMHTKCIPTSSIDIKRWGSDFVCLPCVSEKSANKNENSGIFRTAKAEKRHLHVNNDDREVTFKGFNNADDRILQAEKRAAWRQARMKSLEADAVKAQVVISRAQELKTDPSKNKANISSDLDIAFADDDDGHTQNGQPHSQFFSPSLRKHLIVECRDGETTVEERTRLIGENSHTITEEVTDEKTGQPTFRTVQVIEKTLEREVEVKKQQIYEMKLDERR